MDAQQFDEFYTASFSRVSGAVYAMIGDRDEATECTQEAFARAWSHRRRLESVDHPEAWVRTTAHRLAISRWRRTRRARQPQDRAHAAPTRTSAPSEDHVALMAALQQLPDEQRRALVLHHIVDLPVADVARETRSPEGTVKARLARGRRALAAILNPDLDLQDPSLQHGQGGASHA